MALSQATVDCPHTVQQLHLACTCNGRGSLISAVVCDNGLMAVTWK